MSTDADRLRSRLRGNDLLLVLGVMSGLYVLFTVMGVLLGLDPPGILSTLQQITFFTAVYAMLALALNLQWGYGGLFNIGVAGFMAVGVYTMAMLTAPPSPPPGGVPGLGLPLWVGVLGGMAAAGVIGGVAALPALRLKADYLAIVTLALAEILRISFNSTTLQRVTIAGHEVGTGASRGIATPTNPVMGLFYTTPSNPADGPTALGRALFDAGSAVGMDEPLVVDLTYTLVLVGFVALFYILLYRLVNSPFGRVVKAIREDEMATRSLGKHTQLFKIKVFMVGCALMGLGGILWQGSQALVTPTQFTPIITIYIFIALIIGGSGSITGSVVGAGLFAGLLFQGPPFVSRLVNSLLDVGSPPTTFPDAVAGLSTLNFEPLLAYSLDQIESLRFVLVGAILVYLMVRRPEGILGHRKEVAAATDLDHPDGGDGEDGT
jgi:branched-chain amino acid transport system permease protein